MVDLCVDDLGFVCVRFGEEDSVREVTTSTTIATSTSTTTIIIASPPLYSSSDPWLPPQPAGPPLPPVALSPPSQTVSLEREIKKSKFIAIAGHIPDERSAQSFLSEVQDPRATHNCWAYKVGNQYRSNDDGEPSGTAGKPIHSAIENSGLDRVMVVVIRHFGGIKLGTGGLVRAYGGVAAECLKNAPTRLIKSQVPMGVEVTFDLLGVVYHQLQSFKAEEIKQDYDTGKDGITMVTFKISFDQAEAVQEALKTNCSRDLVFYKH